MKLLLENWREYIKEEGDVNEIFGLGTKKADITSDHRRQIRLLNRQIRGDFSSNQASWYDHYTEDELLTLLTPAPEDYRRGIDLAARALVAIRNVHFNDYVFSREYMKKGTKRLTPNKAANELKNETTRLIDSLEFMRKMYGSLIEAYELHQPDHPIQREIPKDESLEDLQQLMSWMYVSPDSRLEEGILDKFYKRKQKASISLNAIQNIYADYKEYTKHKYRHSGKKPISALTMDHAKKRRMREMETLIPQIQSDIVVLETAAEQMESGQYYWPKELKGVRPPGVKDWKNLSYPEKFLPRLIRQMQIAERNLLNLHRRYAKGLGFDSYTGDVRADFEAIKDFMDTTKER